MLHTHGGLIGSGVRFLSYTRNCLRVVILEGLLMFRIDSVGVDYCFFVLTDSMDRSFVATQVFVDVTSVTIVQFNSSSLIIIY